MFHVLRKGGGTERKKATGERAGTGDREGRIKATLSFIQYVFTPEGRRGILDSLTHGQNNSDKKRRAGKVNTELEKFAQASSFS